MGGTHTAHDTGKRETRAERIKMHTDLAHFNRVMSESPRYNAAAQHVYESLRAGHTSAAHAESELGKATLSAADKREWRDELKRATAQIADGEAKLTAMIDSEGGRGAMSKAAAKAAAPRTSSKASARIPRADSWLRQQTDPTNPHESLARVNGDREALRQQLTDEPKGVLEAQVNRIRAEILAAGGAPGRMPSLKDGAKMAAYIAEKIGTNGAAKSGKAATRGTTVEKSKQSTGKGPRVKAATKAEKPATEMTAKQYREQQIKQVMREYGVSRQEAEQQHTAGSSYQDYMAAVKRQVEQGGVVSLNAYKSMEPLNQRWVMHDYGERHPQITQYLANQAQRAADKAGTSITSGRRAAKNGDTPAVAAERASLTKYYEEAKAEHARLSAASDAAYVRVRAANAKARTIEMTDGKDNKAYRAAARELKMLIKASDAASGEAASAWQTMLQHERTLELFTLGHLPAPKGGKAGSGSYGYKGKLPQVGDVVWIKGTYDPQPVLARVTEVDTRGTEPSVTIRRNTEVSPQTLHTSPDNLFDHKPALRQMSDRNGDFTKLM